MALQLILGNAGAGKSHYIFEKIIQESMEHPTKQYLIIVPEQFTMQTQKDLVMMHPRHGIMNIDVLSFERLAHRVFSEVGGEHRKILEDTGKSLVLRKLAEEKKDELTLLEEASESWDTFLEVKHCCQSSCSIGSNRKTLHRSWSRIRVILSCILS